MKGSYFNNKSIFLKKNVFVTFNFLLLTFNLNKFSNSFKKKLFFF